jgi:hypothetical protein
MRGRNNYTPAPGFFLPMKENHTGTTPESKAALDWLHGCALRNYVTLMKLHEVYQTVLASKPK